MTAMTAAFSPREIVSELDRFIIGQGAAKMAVAIALRNRWRRQQLEGAMREEVLPKNILMTGPTGCGKTEIARRLAKLANAPFIKVEATRFTEVGYVGRDVEQIARDLVDVAVAMETARQHRLVAAQAEANAEERVLDALVGENASVETRRSFREKLRRGELDARRIEIRVRENASLQMPAFEIPGMPGAGLGMLNLNDLLGKALGGSQGKPREVTVAEAHGLLMPEEADKLTDRDAIIRDALRNVEENGIVFLDEIDKIAVRDGQRGGEVSREGVQRDLLPLLEGTTVSTKYGPVKTDHVLFIASGAFHQARPSDLLAELQGRLPIRVALDPLGVADFSRILREPENSLPRQYSALMATEGVTLIFQEDALDRIAALAEEINRSVENIGARRLHTVMERLLEEISFTATDRSGETVLITAEDVTAKVAPLARDADLSRFIL